MDAIFSRDKGSEGFRMNRETTGDNIGWYAIHTHPKQEDRANNNLMAWKVETFSPRVRRIQPNPYARVPTYLSKPLFPRYIFARFEITSMLRKILFTRGVRSVVSFGGILARINDEIITLIQSQVAENGFVEVGEKLKTGDRVMIEDGPLRSLVGVFKRDVKGTDRVLILLAAISYQGSVVIERQHVKKLNSQELPG
jgi:transcription elongation factor/antiterminator RfaH